MHPLLSAAAVCISAATITQMPAQPAAAPAQPAAAPAQSAAVSSESTWFAKIGGWLGLGVILSLLTMAFARWDKANERLLSVVDDYWLRTIVGPMSVEPIFKFVLETSTRLATYAAAPPEVAEWNTFLEKFKKDHRDLIVRARALAAIDAELYRCASGELDKLDDLITEHCARIQLPDKMGEKKAGSSPVQVEALNVYVRLANGLIKEHSLVVKRRSLFGRVRAAIAKSKRQV